MYHYRGNSSPPGGGGRENTFRKDNIVGGKSSRHDAIIMFVSCSFDTINLIEYITSSSTILGYILYRWWWCCASA